MRKLIRNFVIATMLFMSFGIMPNAFGQSPQKFSYQAVIRDGLGVLVTTPVSMRISVLEVTDPLNPVVVYMETHTDVPTNTNGLATLEIGGGTVVGVYDFTTIPWGSGKYSIFTETDILNGVNYTIQGFSNLLSVPFALYSLNGTPGLTGPTGPAGVDGINGIDGINGVDGINGTDGINGVDGATGPAGVDGINGADGLVGPTGPAGIDGINGVDGLVGPTGSAGIDGIAGLNGPTGPQGPAGVLSVNCLECHDHNSATSSQMATSLNNANNEFEHSKHSEGTELAIGEGFSAGCAPCHSHEGMHSVVDGSVIPKYIGNASGVYSFSYNAAASQSSGLLTMPGKISCFTCHKGAASDSMALYTIAAVPMTMYPLYDNTLGGTVTTASKTIDLTQKGGISNLCVKCHQPRPMSYATSTSVKFTQTSTSVTVTLNSTVKGAAVNYADLAANPASIFYDSTLANAASNKFYPSYRSHNHYGVVGAVFAGMGAVEFTGTAVYTNISTHSSTAACQDCHMATPSGVNGGHSFLVTGNFKGCNTSGCHSGLSATSGMFTSTQSTHLANLQALALRLTTGGLEIMHKNTDATSNIFAAVTPEGYDGYLDIYDPSTNPAGLIQNPAEGSSWTAANKTTNYALTRLKPLTNAEWGAIINFQFMLREFSKGVHNPSYSQALFQNTNEALTAVGIP